jgi:hypothetical protein
LNVLIPALEEIFLKGVGLHHERDGAAASAEMFGHLIMRRGWICDQKVRQHFVPKHKFARGENFGSLARITIRRYGGREGHGLNLL